MFRFFFFFGALYIINTLGDLVARCLAHFF